MGTASSSAYLSTPSGNEQPFNVKLTATTATTLVSAPTAGNRKHITRIRATEWTGATPTLILRVLASDAVTVRYLRGPKAMTAYEVYDEFDVLLLAGETLQAIAGTGNVIDVTGLFVDISRGST